MAVNNLIMTHNTTESHTKMLEMPLESAQTEKQIPLYYVELDGCWGVPFYLTRQLKAEEGISASIVRMLDGSTPEKNSLIVCETCGRVVEADHRNKRLVSLCYTQSIDSLEALEYFRTAVIREYVGRRRHHAWHTMHLDGRERVRISPPLISRSWVLCGLALAFLSLDEVVGGITILGAFN